MCNEFRTYGATAFFRAHQSNDSTTNTILNDDESTYQSEYIQQPTNPQSPSNVRTKTITKKKVKRGKKQSKSISLYYNNINGLKSKMES